MSAFLVSFSSLAAKIPFLSLSKSNGWILATGIYPRSTAHVAPLWRENRAQAGEKKNQKKETG